MKEKYLLRTVLEFLRSNYVHKKKIRANKCIFKAFLFSKIQFVKQPRFKKKHLFTLRVPNYDCQTIDAGYSS